MKHLFFFVLLSIVSTFFFLSFNKKSPNESNLLVRKLNQAIKNQGDPDLSKMTNYDTYKFENDTIKQIAYVYYFKPKKICFLLKTINKKTGNICELSDTAIQNYNPILPDPNSYNDEMDGNVLYPVYEFYYEKKGAIISIGIEPFRGKRLLVQVIQDSTKYNIKSDKSCPLSSIGTLRRTKLASIKQFNIPKNYN